MLSTTTYCQGRKGCLESLGFEGYTTDQRFVKRIIRNGKGADIGQGSNAAHSFIANVNSRVVRCCVRMVERSAQLVIACSVQPVCARERDTHYCQLGRFSYKGADKRGVSCLPFETSEFVHIYFWICDTGLSASVCPQYC